MMEIARAVVFAADIELFPDFVESCVELAVIVAVPATAGAKTPELLMVPALDGLTDQVTAELYVPVPVTVDVHVAVCVISMEDGVHETVTDEMVGCDG